MFSSQGNKRSRDEDSDAEDERYAKKTRSWSTQHHERLHIIPHSQFASAIHARPAPMPSPPPHTPLPTIMSPTRSDHSDHGDDDDDPFLRSDSMNDVDMEDFDMISSPPQDSPTFLRPPKLNAELFTEPASSNSNSNTGRVPTPIHSNFFASRGPSLPRNQNYLHPFHHYTNSPAGGIQQQMDAERLNRDRRMPSPISEDDDGPDTPTAWTQSQLSRLSMTGAATGHPACSEAIRVEIPPNSCQGIGANGNSGSRAERKQAEGQENARELHPVAPPSPETMRKGRARSGALSGKIRFSMGYREDCEKCRARIPGHYSHFLPA